MGFLGLRKARWKHADPEVRLRALAELDESAQDAFRSLALEDPDARVRAAAANRVTGAPALQRLAADGDEAVKRIARERLSGVAERLLRERPLAECPGVLESVDDQKSLADLSLHAVDKAVRAAALAKMLALPEPSQALLATIAIQDATGDTGLKALAKIEKRASLKEVAKKAKHESVRAAAAARADRAGAEAAKPSAEQARKARLRALDPLVAQATRLAVAADQDAAAPEWHALEKSWREALALAEGVELEEAAQTLLARFERLRGEAERKAAAERERADAVVAAREAFLAELTATVAIDGEAAAKRSEILARWSALGALARPRYAPLEARFKLQLERLFPADRTPRGVAMESPALPPERQAELETLSAEAERLAAEATNFRDAMPQWHRLHKRWMELGAPLRDSDPLKQRFSVAYGAFKQRRREMIAGRDAERAQRVTALRDLAARAEELAARAATVAGDEAATRELGAQVRGLQAEWKKVGPVRPGDAEPLRARFRTACDAAYAPVAGAREAEDWERSKHLGQAEELTASIEALSSEQDLGKVANAVKRAHQDWKKLGPLPRDRQQAAWERFKTACDTQFERCRPWFAEQDAARALNLEKKRAFIAEIDSLLNREPIGLAGSPADLAARRAATERVKAIQAEWNQLGPVPREHDRETWKAFRKACDAWFDQLRERDTVRRQEEAGNLERKLALCAQAEEFAGQAEAAKANKTGLMTSADVARRGKALQEQWKTIGHVPREQVEAVWQRFRAACDRIWATIRDEREAEAAAEGANLEKKLALIKEVEDILANPNPRWFKDEVKELTRRFRDVGRVPRERAREVDQQFDDLVRKVLRSE